MDDDRRAPEHHRVRMKARLLSWIAVPLLVLAAAFWLLFNAAVCAGGSALPWELVLCRYTHVVPDVAAILVLVSAVWFVHALSTFGLALLPEEQTGRRRSPRRYARHCRHGYRSLREDHRRAARFAIEMSGWALALSVAMLLFYWAQLAFPLGVLAMAAILRMGVALVGLVMAGIRTLGVGGGTMTPTQPT
jgi:hypothetical protein